jgi:GNAT superfamily N-acetyltransferase
MHLRTAVPADALQIAALHAASWRYAYRGVLSDAYLAEQIASERAAFWAKCLKSRLPSQFIVVAEAETQIVGFACAYASADAQWGTLLDNIHVSQALQGKQIGTGLMGAIAQWCVSTTSNKGLFLWVLQSNVHAHRFYQRLGAVKTGVDVWTPPGGGALPRYRYAWPDVEMLNRTVTDSLALPQCRNSV